VLAVLLYEHAGQTVRRNAAAIAAIGAIGLALAIVLYFDLPKDTDLFARTGLFSLISASFAALLPVAANWQRSNLPAPIDASVRTLARWSYALYLCQLAVMRVMDATFAGHAQTFAGCLLQALMFMMLSISCAALVYRYFELPILRWRDRLTRKPVWNADSEAQAKPV